jgi:maleate isomerase
MIDIERGVGVLVPSSNRTVERVTETIFARFPELGACYARIPYWGDNRSGGQKADGYDFDALLTAAELLAHAKVELICWNGTKGAALGFEPDRQLFSAIADKTGIPGVSTALATLDILSRLDISRVAIVSPGTEEGLAVIERGFAGAGIELVGHHCFGVVDNFTCATISSETLGEQAERLARTTCAGAVLIWNTNGRGLRAMAQVEQKVDISVFDSTSIGVWACLDALGIDMAPAADLGSLFRLPKRS